MRNARLWTQVALSAGVIGVLAAAVLWRGKGTPQAVADAGTAVLKANEVKDVDAVKEEGGLIDGRVVDEQGRAIPGAQLEVSGEGAGGEPLAFTAAGVAKGATARLDPSGELGILRGGIPYRPPVPAARVLPEGDARGFVSGAEGGFRLVGLPAGRLVVAASHPEFARGTSEPFVLAAGQTTTLRMVLSRGLTLSGRIVDAREAPVVGAEVLVDGQLAAVSDRSGEFRLSRMAKHALLKVRKAGFVPADREVAPDERADGMPVAIEMRLERAEGRLAGVVLDDRGRPLPGARVEIAAASGPSPAHTQVADRLGRFLADGLPAGPYGVTVTHADFAPLSEGGIMPSDDARFELHPGAGLSGELRDARTGAVPASALVEIVTAGAGGQARTLLLQRGRFEAHALPPGRALLRASAPGYVAFSRELRLEAGRSPREITLADLRIELERGGALSGHVQGDQGPASGAQVSCGAARTRTDARGDFRMEGVPPGRCTLRAEWHGSSATDEVEVRAGDETRADLRL